MAHAENNTPTSRPTGEYYRLALDKTAIVAITNRAGAITYVNDKFCEITWYERDELLGQNHRILNSGTHPEAFFTRMFRTIAQGETWRGDICNRAKNGSLYWVDTTIVPVRDAHGAIESYVSIRSDITARKTREQDTIEAYEHIKQMSSLKTEFFANISHEIRTPLTAILGYAELLRDESIEPAERSTHLNTIRRNGEHLLTMINDLLDASKIEANQMSIERIHTPPIETIVEVISFMQIRADNKGIPLELEFETQIPKVIHTDPVRLRQILINLVGNAIKFTELGGVRVIVGLQDALSDSPMLRIEVADTGIGIDPTNIPNLFRPFQQADASTTRRFGGTGLGLFISQRFANLLGGGIVVRSELGVGSSFVLSVLTGPINPSDLIDAPDAWDAVLSGRERLHALETEQLETRPLTGAGVLLVEDGPDNQRLLTHFLSDAGAAVQLAENGRSALDLIERGGSFDIILMDVFMPEMDGIEATERIRALGCETPIIALTAHVTKEDRIQCLAAGCDDFLTKPIARDRLVGAIGEWIERGARHAA